MKKIRLLTTSLLVLSLVLCLFATTATPVLAAEDEMDDYLAKALGISKNDLNNYAANYAASLPIDYEKTDKSHYVALGGTAARGEAVIGNYADGYTDKTAEILDIDYTNVGKNDLTASEAVNYVSQGRPSVAIPKADLITFQIDAATFIDVSIDGAVNGNAIPWENYVSNASDLAALRNFRNDMAAEYAAEYGQATAKSVAALLEYMLYECVIYSHETVKSVKAIRKLNGDAVILVLGLYNPMRGLSFTANGKTVDFGKMIDQMIKVCNVYLLKQTKDMAKVGFVDISAANTNGFTNVELNMNDSSAIVGQLTSIKTDVNKQYINQAGHDYVRGLILSSAKAPCKHPGTKIVNKKDATCTVAGYTGDIVCKDCNALISAGKDTDKADHTFGAWSQTTAPDCTNKGEQTRTCSVCSHTEKRPVNATGHAWDNGTVTTQPTCSEKGVKTFTCSTCKTTKTESVETTSHSWDEGTTTVEPSCKADGTKVFTCGTCKTTKKETLPALEHTWDDGAITAEPTCAVAGTKLFTCSVCSTTKTEELPTVEHTWNDGDVVSKPTCDTDGSMNVICGVCGLTDTKTIPATDHQFNKYISNNDATCQKDGTKSATCEICGAKDTVTDPSTRTDHVFEDGACIFCNEKESSGNTTGLIIGIVAAVVVLGGGGAVAFLIITKKISLAAIFHK